MKKIFFIIVAFSLFSCNSQPGNNLNPTQKLENYNGNTGFSIEERILPAPDIIIKSLNKMDNVNIYASYELNGNEKQLFLGYYNLLPPKYKNIIDEKVIGIYFVNNFLGGGMTEAVFDNSGAMYMVLFFNPEILHKNITEWINFRDNSIFKNDGSTISLNIVCNSNYYALIHTLLHETSHVFDYYNHITPFTEIFLKTGQSKFPTDFVKNIWNDYDEPVPEYNYENRKTISFYGLGTKTNIGQAFDIFTSLGKTPFNSLYGSKTWAEDFAESFTWYYLKKYHNIDYITTLKKGGNTILLYDPNKNELVKSRYTIFEEIVF